MDRLHYEFHPGDGEPMLLVHGIMGGRGLWAANIEPLREVASPVVVELFGHGRSPAPTDPSPYRPSAYVAELERIRREVGVEQWWLVGQSMGAALTLRYGFDHPDRVLGHIFTNSSSGLADAAWQSRRAENAESEALKIEQAGRDGLRQSRLNPARSRRLVAPVREELGRDEDLLDPAGIANAVRSTVPDASVRPRLATNQVPTLLVAGGAEKGFEEPRRFAEAQMPGLRVVTLDAGHTPNGEVPDEFNRQVIAFVRSRPR